MIATILAGLLASSLAVAGQTAVREETLERVWTCPVHREVTENEPGTCHLCERELVQTLIKSAYSCPTHSVISESEPGRCPICGRELYLVSEEVSYACPMHPEVRGVAPGTCDLCNMALEASTSTRPHQDHNPKHGGIFFMAPDNWHHLEGTYPEDGVFRVYLYDNFSEAMNAESFEGRAVLEEVFDSTTRETKELIAHPLTASEDGSYLEANVGSADLPREITAKLQFEDDGPFERFDFIFADLSVEEALETTDAAGPSGTLVIPQTPEAIARAIEERHGLVRDLVTKGALNEIYLPALEAKDLGVALEAYVPSLTTEIERRELEWALTQLVRSAWLLDGYGDLGNREKVQDAYRLFEEAVEEIGSTFQ